jgi:hypothetical protein
MADSTEDIPFDQGGAAYEARKHWNTNPHAEGSWQHGEWYDGWCNAEQCDSDAAYDWSIDDFNPSAVPSKVT